MTTDIHMIPIGYMATKVQKKPEWLEADGIEDIYSVSGCVSENFADYINYWKHNGYWLFDSPAIIHDLAKNENIDLSATKFFYYETYEYEYDRKKNVWQLFTAEPATAANVELLKRKELEGYDVVTFTASTNPEHSPLSCNSLATTMGVNRHCLLPSFEAAKQLLEDGKFDKGEPGPYRIFAVYSLPENGN